MTSPPPATPQQPGFHDNGGRPIPVAPAFALVCFGAGRAACMQPSKPANGMVLAPR